MLHDVLCRAVCHHLLAASNDGSSKLMGSSAGQPSLVAACRRLYAYISTSALLHRRGVVTTFSSTCSSCSTHSTWLVLHWMVGDAIMQLLPCGLWQDFAAMDLNWTFPASSLFTACRRHLDHGSDSSVSFWGVDALDLHSGASFIFEDPDRVQFCYGSSPYFLFWPSSVSFCIFDERDLFLNWLVSSHLVHNTFRHLGANTFGYTAPCASLFSFNSCWPPCTTCSNASDDLSLRRHVVLLQFASKMGLVGHGAWRTDFHLASFTDFSACRRQRGIDEASMTRGLLDDLVEHLCGIYLSFCALVLAALLRLLLHGCQLRGGTYNVDPLICGGRSLTRGASFAFLLFAYVAQPAVAVPSGLPLGSSVSGDAGCVQSSQCSEGLTSSGYVQRDGCLAQHATQFAQLDVRLEDAGSLLDDALTWKLVTVRVFMFGKVDQYESVWLQEGCTECQALSAVSVILQLDQNELHIHAIHPQLPNDTFDVAVTPAWWAGSDIRFFCFDGSEANRPSYLCTAPAGCTYEDVKAAVGYHLVDGLQLFRGNEMQALAPGCDPGVRDAELVRLRYTGRPRLELPSPAEALADLYWIRDLLELDLPLAPEADGRILVLGLTRNHIYRRTAPMEMLELHRRLATMASSSTDELAMYLPRSDFEKAA